MKPIFTLHAGEFVFGEHVEQRFRDVDLWVPTKDTGIDFLLSDKANRSTVSVQVIMSRDYQPPHASTKFEDSLQAAGWFVFSRKALESSRADIWSIVLISHQRKSQPVFVNIAPTELLRKLVAIHGQQKNYHLYPWVTAEACLEGRGMNKSDKSRFVAGQFDLGERDLTQYWDNWSFIEELGM
ncbi:hypothetical protein QWY79_01240 [Halomonas sabkhae]|uniref:hypothetical protein n=1 Tax=Halomonas sabkhae TaxID=626223 RepID=UPI0025B45CEC|nr:hypothetical protein [Halomonas sabkhae]MDN3523888.1 hypothetical protein [Halomonas sabkhae]